MIFPKTRVKMMTSENTITEQRRTTLCKCGKKADFIKDYFVTEFKTLREGEGDNISKRNVENACGILRRRYCSSCFSRIAAKQRLANSRLNRKILLSVFFPLFIFAVLAAVSYFLLEDSSAIITLITFSVLTVAVTVTLGVMLSVMQKKRKRIEKGDYSNVKAIDALMDSLNFGLEDHKVMKELPSLDVLVDGDGRVNYDMERSGYNMRVLHGGRITLEPMRQRILYPFKDDAEYIKKAYTHAGLLDDNIKSTDVRELTEADFDIKNGELRRYSGLSVEVIIPDGVTKICTQAFKNSKNCERVIIPETVSEIEKEAFAYCPATEINLPQGIKKISSFAFYSSAVRSLTVPSGVEEIEDNAYGECYSLESVYIPANCKKIGEAAFKGCSSLSEITLEEGIESLADYCFNGCSALERIEIPDGCYELGNFAFEGCKALKEVYLPETIQFVGGRVFEGATQMSIYGKQGSYAQSFAEEYRLRFTPLDGPRYKKQHKARRF